MSEGSLDSHAEALRAEIRELERQLSLIDCQLGDDLGDDSGLGSEPLPVGEVAVGKVDPAVSPEGDASGIQATDNAPVVLRDAEQDDERSVSIPFKKVEFREPEDLEAGDVEMRSLRWLGAAVVIASVAGLWMIVVEPALVAKRSASSAVVTPAPPVTHDALRGELEMGESALRAFYRATSVEEILGLIRVPERLERQVHAYYQRHPICSREINFIRPAERVRHEHGAFILAVIDHPDAQEGRQVAVSLEEGGPKVDWELAVNAQRREWLSFPRSPLMMSARSFRVELANSDYYNHGFREADWHSYRLTAPESPEPVYAYAPRLSHLSDRLRQVIDGNYPGPAQIVVSLAVTERVDEIPQLRIFDLEHDHWLLPDEAIPIQPREEDGKLSLVDYF